MAAGNPPRDGPCAPGFPIDRFRSHCRSRPEGDALVWVGDAGEVEQSYTYGELDVTARRLAAGLLGEGLRRGDVVLLAYTPGLDFYVAFWACMLAGIVAVPASPPYGKPDLGRFLAIAESSGAQVVLTDGRFARMVTLKIHKHRAVQLGRGITSVFARRRGRSGSQRGFGQLAGLRWIDTSNLSRDDSGLDLAPQDPDAPAFIMYTSGSTSAPKGVLTSFANLRHQLELAGEALGSSRDHIGCWWAPHFHDFALISGFLNCLHQGCAGVAASPMHFIQRPALWLDMLHAHRVTHTFGPDFGYRLLVKKTSLEERHSGRWDLGHLKVAMSAAEKIRYATLEAFSRAFSVCGFRREAFCPAYGLAEHTVGVTLNGSEARPRLLTVQREELEESGRIVVAKPAGTLGRGTGKGRFKRLVGSGTTWKGTDVRIVELDPEGRPLRIAPPDRVGEIWVSSPSVAAGYHGRPDATAETFHGRLPGVDPASEVGALEFLRTGDLGFLSSGEGELFVCGRLKDMVIVAGKNHYSEDMELSIAEELHGLLRPGRIAAIALEDEETGDEELCVVAEVRDKGVDRAACFEGVRACIARENHIDVWRIALIRPRTIPKTTSGKIRRYLVRDRMLCGELEVVPGGFWQRERRADSVPAPPPDADLLPAAGGAPMGGEGAAAAPGPLTEIARAPGESDFPRLLLDFRNFVSSHGAPAVFPVHFPECGAEFTDWYFLVGLEHLALLFDEEKFYRMPVWNFTAPSPELFDESNFPRWANGAAHRSMKERLAGMVSELTPSTVARALATTDRFLERWAGRESFEWLPEFNAFTTDLFCEVFTGRSLPAATDLFTEVLYGVDPFRKHSFERREVARVDGVEEGRRAKQALRDFIAGEGMAGGGDADLLIGVGGFAVIPALKNLLINLYAQLSSEPAVRQRVLEELRALPRPLGQVGLAEGTPLLGACILETLRLHPPVGHYYARAREDLVVGGVRIPRDANVVGHTWYSYRDPGRFPEPDRFDPDRFLPPRNEHLLGGPEFQPFGTGNPLEGHACPGREVAILIAKAVMARSLLEYDWELVQPAWDDTAFRERYGVPNFEDGMRVRGFRRRGAGELDALLGPAPPAPSTRGSRRPILRAPMQWRVAVVGGGAAGLTAALALGEYGYKVTVFERSSRVGGHACTQVAGGHLGQPGFGVFMEKQWPNACALMRELGVEPTVECAARDAVRHFARDGHTVALDAVQEEATRFYHDMTRVLNDPESDGITVGEFFRREGYSREFICHHFVGRVIHYFAGQALDYYLGYPLRLVAWMYLGNTFHGEEPVLRVRNDLYMAALVERLESRRVRVMTGTEVAVEARSEEGVTLAYHGASEEFGHVILALQPRHALGVLGRCATPQEREVLTGFETTTDTVVMHFDDAWVPGDRSTWGVLNFMLPDEGAPLPSDRDTVPVTTVFPSGTDGRTPVFCTYDYAHAEGWEGEGPHWRRTLEHLRVTPQAQRLRRELRALQGRRAVQFCGSWSRGLTLHEDAVVTGIQAANRILGVDRQYPLRRAALPLAAPFEQAEDSLGSSVGEVLDSLAEILRELLETEAQLGAETDLLTLGLSSFDVGRLVNAVNARLEVGAVSAEEMYSLDTLGEVAERILAIADSGGADVDPLTAPALAARVSGGDDDWCDGRPHPVSLTQGPILESHFAAGQRSGHWNIPIRTWLSGALREDALVRALGRVAERQAVLRTRFTCGADGSLAQHVEADMPDGFFDVLHAQGRDEAIRMAVDESRRPFDVTRGVTRVRLIRVDPALSLLVVVLHHAVADGWSVGVLARELWEHYSALCEDRAVDVSKLPRLPVQLVDHASWQQELQRGGHHDARLAYWRRRLARPLPFLGLSEARVGAGNTDARAVDLAFTREETDGLKRCARAHRTSLNVVLLTAYAMALAEGAGQEAVLVQVPLAGRTGDTEGLIGCFADALILDLAAGRGAGLTEHLRHTHECLHQGVNNAVPLSVLVGGLALPPAQKLKLHRAVLNWEQTLSLRDADGLQKGGLCAAPFSAGGREPAQIAAQTHCVLNVNEGGDGTLEGEWLFSEAAIPEEVAGPLVDRFEALVLEASAAGGDQELGDGGRPDEIAGRSAGDAAPATTGVVIDPFSASDVFGSVE